MKIAGFALAATVALAAFHVEAAAWPSVHSTSKQTYPLTADGLVAIQNASGDVTVTGSSSGGVELTITKTAWSDDDLARLSTTVQPEADHISIAAVYPRHCSNCDISFQLRVPQGAHVAVDTASGDISVTSIGGPVRADSASGDVELHSVSGEVHAHSSSGDLRLANVTGPIDAVDSSGDIEATGLAQDADLVSSSGSVSASFARFDGVRDVRLESTSGDIELTVPRGVGFHVDASTSSGSIDSNLDLPVRDRNVGAAVSAQVGSGNAAVQLRSTSGDISVKMR